MPLALGFDSSNYTTSVAVFDGEDGLNVGKLLEVPAGALGLRQSDALFQHVKAYPALVEELAASGRLDGPIAAVGASTKPRWVEGSYMPCFLAGEALGRSAAATHGAAFVPVSHQQGHLAAAAWSAGHPELLDKPFLAWHLSGGTTELLLVHPGLEAEKLGGTSDISAGQLIDRAGVLLGLGFPCGKAVDQLAQAAQERLKPYTVKLNNFTFSLSGMENKVQDLLAQKTAPETVCAYVLDTVADLICRATAAAMEAHPGLPVLCSGGVASNSLLRQALREGCGALFAPPRYSTDNALGVAILAHRRLCGP